MITKQSKFSRSLWNEAKMGAYYTNLGHSSRIGEMFRFPEETCILEPSYGDAAAVHSFLEAAEKTGGKCYIFGIEMNAEAYEMASGQLDYSLNADFLNGTRITNKAFSFCFTNPPYGQIADNEKERLETKFIERIFSLMKTDGYLVLIVSYPTLCIEKFSKSLLARFTCEGLYRFDDDEYSKFKQIVFIGRRRSSVGILLSEYNEFSCMVDIDQIAYLPEAGEGSVRFEVPGSSEKEVELFTTRQFHPEIVADKLRGSGLYPIMERQLSQSQHQAINITRPILPLKKDLLYLCAVAGGGQGVAGTEERRDVHLQRGTAKRVEDSEIGYDEDGDAYKQVVRSRTQISLNVIDNYGNITELK